MRGTWMWVAAGACSGTEGQTVDTASTHPDAPIVAEVGDDWPYLVTVELRPGSPGPVAVGCVAGDDEALLWEFESGDRPLDLVGLLNDTPYDCTLLELDGDGRTAFTVRTEADDAPTATVESHGSLSPASIPYTLLNTNEQCGGPMARRPSLRIYDIEGRARWSHPLPPGVNLATEARYHGNGLVIWGGGYSPDFALQRLELDHTVQSTLGRSLAPDATHFHHDGKLLDDGTELVLAEVPNTDGTTTWRGWRVIGRGGSWTGSVDSQQLFDDGRLPPGSHDEDVYHANWMDLVDGVLYVHQCFTDDLLALDPATGALHWRVGRLGSSLQLLDDDGTPLPDSELPMCSHGLEVLQDRILYYDNGRYGQRDFSRALELRIDPVDGTATRTWVWTEPSWFDNAMGDIDDLGDGRVLVHMAHVECWGIFPDATTLVELDVGSQEVVWRMTFDDPMVASYRAERIDACDALPHARFCPGVEQRMHELGLR